MGSTTAQPNPDHFYVIKEGHLLPGGTVITDQYECRIKSKIPNTKGNEDPQKLYCGGTFFNDHASSKIDVFHQVSLEASDTIMSKGIYE